MDEYALQLLGHILGGLCANPMLTRGGEGMEDKEIAMEAIGILEETLLILGDRYGEAEEQEERG